MAILWKPLLEDEHPAITYPEDILEQWFPNGEEFDTIKGGGGDSTYVLPLLYD